jgi:hypothetical protein
MDYTFPARLLVAHIIGDFVLQPDSWVESRNRRHFASPYLYIHGLIHFALAMAFSFTADAWWIGAVIGGGHILLDGGKALLRGNSVGAFVVDQMLHLAIIAACWCRLQDIHPAVVLRPLIDAPALWWIATGYLLNIFLYPRFIALATQKWRVHVPPERELLYKAGRWIGIIERILVFTFVLIGQYAAVGFLMAAKSVLRFGDLRESKDKGHTEYVLIGTLLSFGLALITGILLRALVTGKFIQV